MKNFRFNYRILFILLFSFGFTLTTGMKCKKENNLDKDGLPKATQTGAMLFACKVNGENWVAKRSIYDMGGGIKADTLKLWAKISETDYELFSITILNTEIKEGNVYRLNDVNNQYGLYKSNKDCSNTIVHNYSESKSIDGEVIITKIDKSRPVISGTFWFNIPTEKCGYLKVTNGRFDINIGTGNFKQTKIQ